VAAGTDTRTAAFNWMLAISGLSSIFTWGSICLCHIRFRKAWKLNGHTVDELAFKSQATVYGSWLGLIMNGLILVAQFWTGAWPVGYGGLTTSERIEGLWVVIVWPSQVVANPLQFRGLSCCTHCRSFLRSVQIHKEDEDQACPRDWYHVWPPWIGPSRDSCRGESHTS